MDLGATLCTRRRPLCLTCPLNSGCLAYRSGRAEQFPAARQRRVRPEREVVMLLALRADGCVLLQRRPSPGVWGGLWAPPQFDSREAAGSFCTAQLDGAQIDARALPPLRHAFTHFDLTARLVRARCAGAVGAVMEGGAALWYNAREPARIGLPAPISTLLSSLCVD